MPIGSVLRLLLSAVVLYLCMYPVWRFVSPTYQYLLVRSYAAVAPLVESPDKTLEVRFRDNATVVLAAEPYKGFGLSTKEGYVDIPIFLTLLLVVPGLTLRARFRFLILGGGILAVVHFIAQASALQLYYGQFDLRNGIEPSIWMEYGIAPLRRLLYSDLVLVLPFLIVGAMAFRERARR